MSKVNDSLNKLRGAMRRKSLARYPRAAQQDRPAPRDRSEPNEPGHDMTDWLKGEPADKGRGE